MIASKMKASPSELPGAIRGGNGAETYLPIDTLRAAITYPLMSNSTTDNELRDLLKLCRLEHLEPKLDKTENWAQVLSPGEQQRIALLRVLQQKPEWLFLDEATSSVDEETQAMLYNTIKQRLPKITIVSIAHRKSLLHFHDLHYDVTKKIWTKPA